MFDEFSSRVFLNHTLKRISSDKGKHYGFLIAQITKQTKLEIRNFCFVFANLLLTPPAKFVKLGHSNETHVVATNSKYLRFFHRTSKKLSKNTHVQG